MSFNVIDETKTGSELGWLTDAGGADVQTSPRGHSGNGGDSSPVVPSAVLQLIDVLDRGREHGILTVSDDGGEELGKVVVANGRVCLVGGTPGQRRLGELLRAAHPETAAAVTTAIRRARREKLLIGELLLTLGEPPVKHIRACLLQQIGAALSSIAAASWDADACYWQPLQGHYHELLTFSLAEAYFATVTRFRPATNDAAVRLFLAFAADSGWSVLAVANPGMLCPLPVITAGLTLERPSDIRRLGKALSAFSRPPALLAADIAPRLLLFRSESSAGASINTQQHIACFGGLSLRAVAALARDAHGYWEESQ